MGSINFSPIISLLRLTHTMSAAYPSNKWRRTGPSETETTESGGVSATQLLNAIRKGSPLPKTNAKDAYALLMNLISTGQLAFDKQVRDFLQMLLQDNLTSVFTHVSELPSHLQESASIVVHFDHSGSMARTAFLDVRAEILQVLENLQDIGVTIWISLFGHTHETNSRIMSLNNYKSLSVRGGKFYAPSGRYTYLGPSFQKVSEAQIGPHISIIFSDGALSDAHRVERFSMQHDAREVFFVYPAWVARGAAEQHTSILPSRYPEGTHMKYLPSSNIGELGKILASSVGTGFLPRTIPGFVALGSYLVPEHVLNPTIMSKLLRSAKELDTEELHEFQERLTMIFESLRQTFNVNFLATIRSEMFLQLMSLLVPLIKFADNANWYDLHAYLSGVLDEAALCKDTAVRSASSDKVAEIEAFWEEAMTISEREIIKENYGSPTMGFCLPDTINIDPDTLGKMMKMCRTIHAPDYELLAEIIALLSTLVSGQATKNGCGFYPSSAINTLRTLPGLIQDLQEMMGVCVTKGWTIQQLTAYRLACVLLSNMRNGVSFDKRFEFVLYKTVCDMPEDIKTLLIDTGTPENRSLFWCKIILSLQSDLALSDTVIQEYMQLLVAHLAIIQIQKISSVERIPVEVPIADQVNFPLPPTAYCLIEDKEDNPYKVIPMDVEPTEDISELQWRTCGAAWRIVYDSEGMPFGRIFGGINPEIQRRADLLLVIRNNGLTPEEAKIQLNTILLCNDGLVPVAFTPEEQLDIGTQISELCEAAPMRYCEEIVVLTRAEIVAAILARIEPDIVPEIIRPVTFWIRAFLCSALGVEDLPYSEKLATIYNDAHRLDLVEPTMNPRSDEVAQHIEEAVENFIAGMHRVVALPTFATDIIGVPADVVDTDDAPLEFEEFAVLQPQSETDVPNAFICPITYEIMENPVVASDGHTYGRDAIEVWITRNGTSPFTRAPLTNELLPNRPLKEMIDEFIENNREWAIENISWITVE